jgi:hypothetical protein
VRLVLLFVGVSLRQDSLSYKDFGFQSFVTTLHRILLNNNQSKVSHFTLYPLNLASDSYKTGSDCNSSNTRA